MQTIQKMIEATLNTEQPVVLAMIVDVEGSAYRKEGAWMLFQQDGIPLGVISGGCLENDLQSRARDLFGTGSVEVVQYDLSSEDDLSWGRGAGCNGVVSILMRDIDWDFKQFLSLTHQVLQAKEPVLFIQSMSSFTKYGGITQKDQRYGSWEDDIPFKMDATIPFQHLAGQETIRDKRVYVQFIWPEPPLYIIGAGADARPLARLAQDVGYAVHLLDWRQSLCNEIHFPMARSFRIGDVGKLVEAIQFSPLDSIVIMTHDFQHDRNIIQQIRHAKLLYVGILGSKKRTKRLFDGEIPTGVHSPIGIAIDADGPEEIAVSIAAELIAARRRKVV
ncbi:XdhC family protein [Sporosarcina beigongshangi]|uniref:XdhC family protein n=1 Tax=Sporosarcina beigongshangi TaxID=2782538 RepID=UPI00193ABB1F|nr:XdhC family protein [Sporosarcina beigongshangi]